jgi:hypothetical protein
MRSRSVDVWPRQDYIRRVFLSALPNLRQRADLTDEEVVLLMDSCRPHVTQEVLDFLTEACVRVVTFAPHTTNIFQILDLTLFGVFKRQRQYRLPFETENHTSNFLLNIYKDFLSTMIDTNIWTAFRGIGLSFDEIGGVQRLIRRDNFEAKQGVSGAVDARLPSGGTVGSMP